MRKNLIRADGRAGGKTPSPAEAMNYYFAAHPGSPAAVRRPQLLMRGALWVAILGPNAEEGIVGVGPTVEAALGDFDNQYLSRLYPEAKRQRKTR